MRHFDVVIIGAGPAGSSTALALRKSHPHLSTLLLEASEFQSVRPGETLSLDAIPLLQQLEVFDFFLEQNHPVLGAQSGCVRSPFGVGNNEDAGGGWHLERGRFDSMLAGYAAASGAAFMRATLSRVQLGGNGLWQLTANAGAVSHVLSASFVVDASGRSAHFASEIGIAQTAHDNLVCLSRTLELSKPAKAGGCLTEAWEHGWWYSVPAGGRSITVSIMTDADLVKRLQLSDTEAWLQHVHEAPQTSERIGQARPEDEVHTRPAHTRNLASYAGSNWLAVGDAATCIDPLASQGILRSLRLGLDAGNIVGAQFGKRAPIGLQDYVQLVQAEFDNNLSQRLEDYRMEQRWSTAPFWTRRHAGYQLTPASAHAEGRNAMPLGGSHSSQA